MKINKNNWNVNHPYKSVKNFANKSNGCMISSLKIISFSFLIAGIIIYLVLN